MSTEKRFDISESYANESLRQVGLQGEVQIGYSDADVEGVRTPELHGRYSPELALSQLLDGTPLTVVQASVKGTFIVLREDREVGDQIKTTPETPTIQETEMNPKKNKLLKTFGAILTVGIVGSQGPLTAQDDEEEEIFELSPFTVDASDNLGYAATSTLAGTRIKTNLSDVGSAISVLTAEVFKDTGATDAESILPYSLNVEVAGVQGNFADVSAAGGQRVRSNSTARSGTSNTRVRGLSPAVLSRGLFQTDIPFDSYNTSRVTINRGPNSLLFGASTPGGVIDQSLNRAELGRNFGSFEFRIGERGSNRFVFDANKVLVEERLALRVSLLDDETNYQQRPTFKEDRRVYADLHAVLFNGSDGGILGRTSLRGNVEYGEVDSNPPKLTPPGNGFTDFFEAPDRSLEQFTGTTFPDWVDTFVPKTTVDNLLPNNVVQNEAPISISQPSFINIALFYAQPDLQAPSIGIPGMEEVAGMPARTRWFGQGGRPRVRDTWATFPFLGRSEFTPGFTVPSINDRNVFDNQNNAIAGTLSYRNSDFDVQSIALEQELFNGKGGFEIAYDRQSFENEYFDPFSGGSENGFRSNEVRVDISRFLTNEQPNPNLGRLFMTDFQTQYHFQTSERESKRFTAFYELDFTEKYGFARKLGRHVFTGFYSEDSHEQMNTARQNKWINVPGSNSPFPIEDIVFSRINGGRRNAPILIYFGDSLLDPSIQSESDIRINQFINIASPEPGLQAINHFHPDPTANIPLVLDDPVAAPLRAETFELVRPLINGDILRTENRAKSLGWQSYFFGGNLVGVLGWRDDSVRTIENVRLASFLDAVPDANADGRLDDGELDPRTIRLVDKNNPFSADASDTLEADSLVPSADGTFTWSVVGHLPENILKLPGGANLSVHYNESESFVAGRSRRDFNGNGIPPESGSTKEYGFTLSTRDKRLSARVNWFKLQQNGATVDPNVAPLAPGRIAGSLGFWKDSQISQIPFEEALLNGETTRPVLTTPIDPALPDDVKYEMIFDQIIGLLPQTQRDLYDLRFSDSGQVLMTENPGQSVITSAVAEGFEVDIVGNINESWAIILNYGNQETVTSDSAPVAGEFVNAVAENIVSTGLANVVQVPGRNEPGTILDAWNGNVNRLNALRGRDGTVSLEQREHRINLINTYSFLGDSRLKGLTVGGALRWQSSIATGYETTVEDGVVTPIISRPFFGPEELNGDVWISYKREINPFGDHPIDWKIQLNVRNAIGDDDYIPVVTNPDGRVAVVRNPPTREFFLTNTFSF